MSRWRSAWLAPPPRTRVKAVNEIRITRHGEIEAIEAIGEFDLSNIEGLDDALQTALSRGPAASCLLDLSAVTFMDSTVLKALVRWSKETQVSEREGLAIFVGDPDSPASRRFSNWWALQSGCRPFRPSTPRRRRSKPARSRDQSDRSGG